MSAYTKEVWATVICLILVSITGGFLSSIFVMTHEFFFEKVEAPAHLADVYANFFIVKEELTVLGFPLHYFLLIVLSWIGVTIIGIIWCLIMDRLEDQQRY